MLEQSPIGPIYDFSPGSPYWRALDGVARTAAHSYVEQDGATAQTTMRDMARFRRGPDAETVLRGLPAILRGEALPPPLIIEAPAAVPRTAAQAILRMAQGPSVPPGDGLRAVQ